jgi:hypothetical protein
MICITLKKYVKMKLRYIFTIGAVALLASCSNDIEGLTDSTDVMHFSVNLNSSTRVTGSSFDENDAIGVYVTQYSGDTTTPLQVSGNYANNAKTVLSNGVWTSTPTIYWGEGKFDVFAYYPYTTPSSVDEYPFTVALDQSTTKTDGSLGGYEASDFLWAKATGVSQTESVPLNFSHKMSRLVVNLVKSSDYTGSLPTDAVVRIHNTVPAAYIDLANGVVTKNSHESVQSITAHPLSADEESVKYEAIIVPQRLDNFLPFVEILASGVSYMVESKFVFKAGTTHTLTVELSDSPSNIKISIGGEISGWE